MRVLMTTDTIGGVWTFTRELAAGLLKRDCTVAIASFGPPPTAAQKQWIQGQSVRWYEQFDFASSEAPLEWMPDNQSAYSAGGRFLMSFAEAFQPDVLISSQYCFGAVPLPVPRIVVAHSDVLSWAKACRPQGLEQSEWLKHYCAMVKAGITQADAVVAPTLWMLEALGEEFAPLPEAYVIPNGITLSPVPVERLRKVQAVVAGRLWDEAKNFEILEQVESAMPIIAAGELGPRQPTSRRSGSKLRFTGHLEHEELLKLFRQSMVYICTSKYEPFGYSAIEAALCGCLVVANDIPSLREVWGDHALFFQDAASLSTLLTMLKENPSFRARARRRSLMRASHFTTRQMCNQYFDLLQSYMPTSESDSYAA
jgi:glycogen synthase